MLDLQNKKEKCKKLKTKFGQILQDPEKVIFFDSGLVGIPQTKQYFLTDCPIEKFGEQFKVMCAYNDENLSFLVLPINFRIQNFYPMEVIAPVLHELEYNVDNTGMLLIVGTTETENGKKLTANLKAPIFIDLTRQVAKQYVFHNQDYPLALIL